MGGTRRRCLLSGIALLIALIAAASVAIWQLDHTMTTVKHKVHLNPALLTSHSYLLAPLPRPGFVWYTDLGNGFAIQYPRDWRVLPLNQSPGVEFDTQLVPSAICQIFMPAPDLSPRRQPATALDWGESRVG
jgi:hypothetical protein